MHISEISKTLAISPGAELTFLTDGLTSQLTQSEQTRQTPWSFRESTAYWATARLTDEKREMKNKKNENVTLDHLIWFCLRMALK